MTDSSSDPNHVQTNSSTKDSLIQSAYSSKVIILLSSTNPGTSLKHFIQVYSVCSTVFNTVHIATTTGFVVPDADGFYFEPQSPAIHSFLEYFLKFRKPICLIGSGTAVLFSTEPNTGDMWMFRRHALTAPSNLSLVKANTYTTCRSVEDFIGDLYGRYSTSKNESLHIVIDDNIVTAQTKNSTLIAIQAFTLLCNR
ncbi:hypothetical protein BASA62_005699 [Batrachochytrium salamandrivorans]|nr:hypothetical protein BASA62_005699 [Batrachochytrium salamandrivorans]